MIVDKLILERMIELASEMTEVANSSGSKWSLSLVFDDTTTDALAAVVVCADEVTDELVGNTEVIPDKPNASKH